MLKEKEKNSSNPRKEEKKKEKKNPHLDHVLNAGTVGLNHRLNPNERLDLGVQAVRHELEVTIGGDEGNGAVSVEARQADTLVELDVFHLNSLSLGG